MIIHSYLTNGFYPWAELFLESLRFHHGIDNKVILSTRDLTMKQMRKLFELYPNIIINNKPLDIELMSKKSGLSIEKLMKYKHEIETKCISGNNVIWKQFISVEDRYRNSIVEAIEESIDIIKENHTTETHLLHTDIDMYIRQPLDDLFEIVESHDISIKFRLLGLATLMSAADRIVLKSRVMRSMATMPCQLPLTIFCPVRKERSPSINMLPTPAIIMPKMIMTSTVSSSVKPFCLGFANILVIRYERS